MTHIDFDESIQRKATKQLPGMKDLDYPDRLRRLNIPTPSYRGVRGDMIEMYKITHGVYMIAIGDRALNFRKSFPPAWTITRGNSYTTHPHTNASEEECVCCTNCTSV